MEQKRKLLFIHRKRKKKITGQPIVWLIIYLVLKTSYTGEKNHIGHTWDMSKNVEL